MSLLKRAKKDGREENGKGWRRGGDKREREVRQRLTTGINTRGRDAGVKQQGIGQGHREAGQTQGPARTGEPKGRQGAGQTQGPARTGEPKGRQGPGQEADLSRLEPKQK